MNVEFKMAWRNIWRNPRRTVLTICAIAFASFLLVFMLSFQFGSYETMINTTVKMSTGHLKVYAKEWHGNKEMRFTIDNPKAVAGRLDRIAGIKAYSFRSSGFSLISSEDRTYGVLVTGINPEAEGKISTIKSLIRKGSYLDENDQNKVIVGGLLAKNLKVNIDDELTIMGQGKDGSVAAAVVIIKGIFESGMDEFDRNAIMLGQNDFNEIFSMNGSVHETVIIAESITVVSKIKKDIRGALNGISSENSLAVFDWMEIMPGLLQSIQMDLVSGIIMYLILVIVVAFSIFNTFVMAVFERTREFGVMMAIGTTPGRLTKLVLYESACMTFVGILVGIILGCLVTLWFQKHGVYIAGTADIMSQYGLPERLYPKLNIFTALAGPLAVFMITIISAVFPALKIKRLKPVEAMNHV